VIEHQRRQIEIGMQAIADAGLAIDGNAGGKQVSDVAIDSALGNLQPTGELGSGGKSPPAEVMNDFKKTIGTAHEGEVYRRAATRDSPETFLRENRPCASRRLRTLVKSHHGNASPVFAW